MRCIPLPRLALLVLFAVLAGCGGEPSAPADPDGAEAPVAPATDAAATDVDGALALRLGERELITEGRVTVSVVTPSATMVNCTLKGSVGGGTMLEPKDLWFILKLDATEPGTYPLVRYDTMVTDQDGSQGWIEIDASRAVDLPKLSPESGSITLEQVALGGDGTPQPTRLVGSFEGTCFGAGDDLHAVSGTFDFAAP